MIEFISQPWPWYIGGAMITLVMVLLLLLGRSFGVSSTFRTLCTIGGAGKQYDFFAFDWKAEGWKLVFVLGGLIGGIIAANFLMNPEPIALSSATVGELSALGVSTNTNILAPPEIFSWQALGTAKGWIFLLGGGFLVGFGARYADGCTSGHAISGLSNLQLPSLITVIGFFIGGLIMTFLILPWLL